MILTIILGYNLGKEAVTNSSTTTIKKPLSVIISVKIKPFYHGFAVTLLA